ncbi:MAG: hypothetical protein RIS35_2710 [Pseudomonadota bacterium]|jgi:transcriptional regulator of acetoin/glycerol metabolism
MRTPVQATALRQARQHFVAHGQCPDGAVDERLARSWRRSLEAGLMPTGRFGPPDLLGQRGLSELKARHHALIAHSRPVMEHLFEQVRHSQSVVVLAGPCGTLMHTLGDPYFLSKAERVSLSCGASWHEAQRGTNAIGTALEEMRAVEIHGAEHYLERNGFLTCAAAPILSGTGRLLGVLDISGEHGRGSPHTLGLVDIAARMIENRLLAAASQPHLRIHLHAQPEGIGTVAESIVAVSGDGWVVGTNRRALAMLGLSASQVGAVRLEDLIDARAEELLARHHRRPGRPLQVRTRDGSLLFAQLHPDPAAVRARPQPAAESLPADALALLDTGDARWRSAAAQTRRILGRPIPLLIQGESGVGKELFARGAHESGPRRDGPFVAVNCAAIPETLIESELFGYAPGAFTGARREGRPGLLREAHTGTLFLDEIGDMPATMQARLLRVLQERQVVPLGGGRPVPVDFALVCATHRRLRDEVQAGRFRSDLYYRIDGLTIELPALRERTDFEALTESLLAGIEPEREIVAAPTLAAALARYPWPGNLRQYASMLRTACAMLDPDETVLDWRHLSEDFRGELQRAGAPHDPAGPERPPQNLEELSRAAIRQALESCRGNVSHAARVLGISRQTLYRKIAEGKRLPDR